jgi:Tol biopolymer transport system component
MMNKPIFLVLAALTITPLLAGCQPTLEVGIEHTPTPDRAMAATVTALVEENRRLATQVAVQLTPVPAAHLGQLAYVQGGDIWIRGLLDEPPELRRLTTDGRNREPRWSASGRWLAFRKDKPVTVVQPVPFSMPTSPTVVYLSSVTVLQKQLWLIQSDGEAAYLLNESSFVDAFAWSPTSERLAYVNGVGHLKVVEPVWTDPISLVFGFAPGHEPGQVGRMAWSPDGTRLAYEWWERSPGKAPTYQGLWMVDAESGEQVELYNSGMPGKGEAVLAGWSSLGKDVLFWQQETPSVSLIDGGHLYGVSAVEPQAAPVQMSFEVMLAYPDFVVPAPPDVENQEITAFVIGDGRSTWKNKRIRSAGQTITPKEMATISPVWSPDGTRLAFVAMPAYDELAYGDLEALMQRHIWIVNAFGSPQLHRLTDTAGYRDECPRWSADGRYILFVRLNVAGQVSLWMMPSGTGIPRQVVSELTPAPDPFDFYGHVDWTVLFDWWRAP